MVFCIQNSDVSTRIASLYGSQPSFVVFKCKTATFGSQLQVSMGPRLRLLFLHAKQRLEEYNYKSLSVQTSPMVFCIQNSDFSTRIASLYVSQPSFVVLHIHNSDTMTRINSLYRSQTSPVILCMQNNVINTRVTSLHESLTTPVVLCMIQIDACLLLPALICGFWMQNIDFRTRIAGLYVTHPHLWFLCIHNSDIMTWINSLYGTQTSPMFFFIQNSDFSNRIASLYGSQTSPVDLWMQNSVLRSRMTLAYCSQPSSVVLCVQNSDFSIWITSLYWSQPSFVCFFACKTGPFGSQLQVSMVPRLRMLICECITACLDPEWRLSIGPSLHLWFPRPHLSFCACKTTWLASELLVSRGLSPHFWILHAK